MNLNLPEKSRLISAFILVFIIGVSYVFLVKIPTSQENKTPVSINNSEVVKTVPYFIPPSSTTKEVKINGKIVAAPGEKNGATHKIVDLNNNLLVYAKTNDDKLKQQEGNVITVVGDIPISQEVGPTVILDVQYISFK